MVSKISRYTRVYSRLSFSPCPKPGCRRHREQHHFSLQHFSLEILASHSSHCLSADVPVSNFLPISMHLANGKLNESLDHCSSDPRSSLQKSQGSSCPLAPPLNSVHQLHACGLIRWNTQLRLL